MYPEPGMWAEEEHAAGHALAVAFEDHFAKGKGVPEGPPDLDLLGPIAEAQAANEVALLALPNVVGVAPSIKVTAGKPTGEPALTVLVDTKKSKRALGAGAVVPDTVDGVPTDVVEVGVIRALTFNARVRPTLPGYSIGHHDITAGTFGCLVRDLRRCCACGCPDGTCSCGGHSHGHGHRHSGHDYLILSNNHVLANSNAGRPGDSILQPGAFDGGVFPSDEVARLERFERITFGAAGYNLVDAAVARPTASRNVISAIIAVVTPRGISEAQVGTPVIKVGRTTQVTTGRVLSTNATVAVNYGAPGVAVYRHQIITTAMSAGGDSGSLLMDRSLNAVGLLFAGSATVTIHNHIADVETALGVRPVTSNRTA